MGYLGAALLLAFSGIQIYFCLKGIAIFKAHSPGRSAEKPDIQEGVSIVICAHDEEENIRQLLPLLFEQQYPDFEIIVVNDCSNDGTLDELIKAKQHWQKKGRDEFFRYIPVWFRPDKTHPKKYGLTLGIKMARNPIILLTDADCRPASENWISHMVNNFGRETEMVLGLSPYFYRNTWLNRFIRFETQLTAMLMTSRTFISKPYMGLGRNLAYRKSFFFNSKGFAPFWNITGGDDDLFVNRNSTKENTKICTDSDAFVYSYPKNKLRDYVKQKIRHLSVGRYYKKEDRKQLGYIYGSQMGFWATVFAGLFLGTEPYFILVSFVSRAFVLSFLFTYFDRKFKFPGPRLHGIYLDFFYFLFSLVIGLQASVRKKISWL